MYLEEEKQTFKCISLKYADVFILNDMSRLSALVIIAQLLQNRNLYLESVNGPFITKNRNGYNHVIFIYCSLI